MSRPNVFTTVFTACIRLQLITHERLLTNSRPRIYSSRTERTISIGTATTTTTAAAAAVATTVVL